ncbi:AbrB/MazE/SpoVT family DNA-binding domain-containing protein [Xenorhabdus stockiae]|uniref:AbrB/MazE/SpoVT family DNA-binding domain-containing protein n=1 Tax=Xenorhabdus stockiae TaxID=351614 RepID=UPI003CED81DF
MNSNNNELCNLLREYSTPHVREKEYDLDSLLAGVNDKNIHEEVDFGSPVGKETT